MSAVTLALLGVSGLFVLLLRFVGPLTAVSTNVMMYLTLLDSAASRLDQHWGITALLVNNSSVWLVNRIGIYSSVSGTGFLNALCYSATN